MKKHITIIKLISYIILFIGAITILVPFAWMILTSLKPSNEVLQMPPKWIPSKFLWKNYVEAYKAISFGQYFFNSVFVAICVTTGELITTILAAFAFSNIDFKFKHIIFITLISTMMVPSEILLVPNYVTLSEFGWINSYKALIIPWCASIFSIFLLRQQFLKIPDSYYKAAKMDGCSDFRYLFTIMVPMSIPTLMSISILKFINCWNSYMWPLIVTNSTEMRTLPVALAAFSTEAGTKYNMLMAFSAMIIIPVLIMYFLTQKYIIKGIGKSGLKG
jgi:multiple sugar transport system permease protein